MSNTTSSCPSADELIQIIRDHYPAGIESYDPAYTTTPEARRLNAVLQPVRAELQAGRKDTRWARFLMDIRRVFAGSMIFDTTPPPNDPCYCCRVYLPGVNTGSDTADCIVALISLLAPVYAIYGSHQGPLRDHTDSWVKFPPLPAAFQPHEARLAEQIERHFSFARAPNDVLFAPVPDRVSRDAHQNLGESLLIDCLFTYHRW